MTALPRAAILSVLLALAACGREAAQSDGPDNSDPAVAVALSRPIMTDARLEHDSNRDKLRPAEGAIQAMLPPGDGATARELLRDRARALVTSSFPVSSGCSWNVAYSYSWAARVPVEARLPTDGQTIESAGSDSTGCSLRLVTFSSAVAADAIVADYRKQAVAAGYAIGKAPLSNGPGLVATRPRDAAILIVAAQTRGSVTTVDLVTNRGD